MRLFAFLLLASTLAAPAAAQKIGERTAAPAEILAQMGSGNSDEEIARAIAAASAFPLGTAENPIRVGGPEGARAYAMRLRCADGSAPTVGTGEAAGIGAFGSVVNALAINCGAAAPGQARLVFDIYHAGHREDRAPAGFTLAAR